LPFLCARICHSVISSLLMYFAFDWWMSLWNFDKFPFLIGYIQTIP
jgi:hypothetical protein